MKNYLLKRLFTFLIFMVIGWLVKTGISQEKPIIRVLGKANNENELTAITPAGSEFAVKAAARRAFMKANPGGTYDFSFSMNGKYTAVKEVDPELSDPEIIIVNTKIIDQYGSVLWTGKTGPDLIISNNGRTFVASNFAFPYELSIYDVNSQKPIKTLGNLTVEGWAFSEDGNYLTIWSGGGVHFFTADGEKIWKKNIFCLGKGAIAPDGSKVIVYGKLREQQKNKQKTENFKKPMLSRSRLRTKEIPFTIINRDGNTKTIIIQKTGVIRDIKFSKGEGKYFVIGTPGWIYKYDTEGYELIWSYCLFDQKNSYDLSDIEISGDNNYIFITYGKYPLYNKPGKPYVESAIINKDGKLIEKIAFKNEPPTVSSFLQNDESIILFNNYYKKYYSISLK